MICLLNLLGPFTRKRWQNCSWTKTVNPFLNQAVASLQVSEQKLITDTTLTSWKRVLYIEIKTQELGQYEPLNLG